MAAVTAVNLAVPGRGGEMTPSRDEILAAISAVDWDEDGGLPEWATTGAKEEARLATLCARFGVRAARTAVEKLFKDAPPQVPVDREALAQAAHMYYCHERHAEKHPFDQDDYDKADEILEILGLLPPVQVD